MMILRLPTTLCVRRESGGAREENLRVSLFALFSPWEPGYEQTD